MMNSKKIMLIFGLISGGISIILHFIQYYFNFQISVIERIIFVVLPVFFTIFAVFFGIYFSKKTEFSQMLKILFLKYGAPTGYLEHSMEMQLAQIQQQQPDISSEELSQIKMQMKESQTLMMQFNMTLIKNVFFGFFISLGSSAILKIIQKNKL